MSEKRRGLGRGLGALIPSGPAAPSVQEAKKESDSSETDQTPQSTTTRSKASGLEKTTASSKKREAAAADKKSSSAGDKSSSTKDAPKAKSPSSRKPKASPRPTSSPSTARSKTNTTKTSRAANRVVSSTEPESDNVSRETSGNSAAPKVSTIETSTGSPSTPAKSRKSGTRGRRDMGQALRSTTSVRRPVDMFFLPSESSDKIEMDDASGASSKVDTSTNTEAVEKSVEHKHADGTTSGDSKADVSRETSGRSAAGNSSESAPGEESAAQSGRKVTTVANNASDRVDTDDKAIPAQSLETSNVTSKDSSPEKDSPKAGKDEGKSAESPVATNDVSRETSTNDQVNAHTEDLAMVPGAQFAEISVSDIHPNRKQPRQVFDEDELAELAFSVKELGVLQPVVVRPSREDEGAKYELVMGERRWRAVQKAGLDSIPAIIRETSDDDLLRDALLENLHRSQLNPLEEAAAYQQLLEEFGATQDELSQRIGRSRPQISNTLRLLRLPPLVQRRVAAGVLSSGHARALLGLTDPAEMERLAQRIVAEGMSVRATEETVALSDGLKRHATKRKTATHRHDDRLNYIADAFSDRLDTSVKIQLGARKGKMTIEFASVEDLNRIIDVLDPKMED